MLSGNDKQLGNLDAVKNFIFGLCNTTTYKHLIALRSNSCPESLDFNKKKSFLEQFVCEYAKDTDNFSKHLKICSKLYEMHDRELTKKVVERFPEKWEITFRHLIFPHDVGRLFHVSFMYKSKYWRIEAKNIWL